MDIAVVDRSAVSGNSTLHGAATGAKLIAFSLVLAAVVVSTNLFVVLTITIVLLAAVAALRLPARSMLPLAAYPAVFAAVFAFASAPDALAASLIIAKAVTAALASVTLMFTTPYPQVFAALQRVTPGLVGDTLLMTYRAIFILADKLGDLTRAVRLRSGLSTGHPVRAARATTRALGGLLLYSLDLAQREYDVLVLRGYSGRLRVALRPSRSRAADSAIIVVAFMLLCLAALWRIYWIRLISYSWILLAVALVGLGVALASRRRT
ncbi:MAG: energy-coupling factor transporter transmembrane component T [Actinomycetota bacterium]|nr:MAG: cobalt/nickel transport system permease [Actinomycetota bacterium]MDO8950513.1 energy-coupling factor transporter transmembrane component T [Actinomycetota bacterium]MDP3631499.1 energy-coupling factor transporter transmembrane component T [Actinomycetota bacterium]